jgi:glyoxylase-like metal-dependent hydrolase (beta-lactamase superfamily II)
MSDSWHVDVLLEGSSVMSSCTLVSSRACRVLVDTSLSIEEPALLAALRARHLEPADIDVVVNTHLHIDHCGNNALFPRAAIYASKAEFDWALAFYDAIFASPVPERVAGAFYPELAASDVKTRTIRSVARIARLFWNRSRLGDESRFRWLESSNLPAGLEVLETPGHTPHHLSIRVGGISPVIIAGDAVLAAAADAKVRTMIPYSLAQAVETRRALVESGAMIVPGHGPAFEPGAADPVRPRPRAH